MSSTSALLQSFSTRPCPPTGLKPLQPLRLLRPHPSSVSSLSAPERRSGLLVVGATSKGPEPTEEETQTLLTKLGAPVSALVLCALLTSAVIPEEADAARSGGRMGGSSFRSRGPSMPRGGGGYRQYNYYASPGIAPPLVGGYGYGIMPSFFFPVGFGGIFNIFIALFLISAVSNAIQGFKNRDNDRDDFDDEF